MSWIKKIGAVLIITTVTFMLLEVGSALILHFRGDELNPVQSEFIFEKTNPDGLIIPTHEYVLPIKKNFFIKQENTTFKKEYREFSVSVKTNSLGLREDFEIPYSKVKVAFFGDSFTFGHGVNVDERYTNVFAKHFYKKYRNKTVSFSYKNGWQPEHYEFFFRNNEDLRPSYVIVGVYLGNDLGADVLETEYDPKTNQLKVPYQIITENGQMENAPDVYRWPLNWLRDKSYFFTLLIKAVGRSTFHSLLFKRSSECVDSTNDISLELGLTDLSENRAVQSLVRLEKIVQNRGSKFTVLIIPQNYFFHDNNPHIHQDLKSKLNEVRAGRNILVAFKEVCSKYKLDCYDPSDLLDGNDYYTYDPHWKKSGHEKIGKALAIYLRRSQ